MVRGRPPARCDDGIQNGYELGLDCGGLCLPCRQPPPPGDEPLRPTNLADASRFLYTGPNAPQQGVQPGAIDPTSVAVLKGRVVDVAGAPVGGASIRVRGHDELGQTESSTSGDYAMAVNGGGLLTIELSKAGYLPVQRQISPWSRNYLVVEEVALTALDPRVTAVDFTQPIQSHQATPVHDAAGPRQATVLFRQGTTAVMELPNGQVQPLPSIHVRATEYTVGPSGPHAMPGSLPPSSGYTYALELSVDEALAAGATNVRFDRPVVGYVENFLDFAAGIRVPVGYYDRARAAWIPADNGRVIEILSVSNGVATLAVGAPGVSATPEELSALGIDALELSELGRLYQPGTSLWRYTVQHFTPWDLNFPFIPPPDAVYPPAPDPALDEDSDEDECEAGSVIECGNGTLGERIPLPGTQLKLVYQSGHQPGRNSRYLIRVPIKGPFPASCSGVIVEIAVAGRQFNFDVGPVADTSVDLQWDGLDAFGRRAVGANPVSIRIGYRYPGVRVGRTDDLSRAFALPAFTGDPARTPSPDRARSEIIFWSDAGGQPTARALGDLVPKVFALGGLTLDQLHVFDAQRGRLYLGNGRQRAGANHTKISGVLRSLGFQARDLAWGVGGVMYGITHNSIWRMPRGGARETIAGDESSTLNQASLGDGALALGAQLNMPRHLAVGPDGSVYFTEWSEAIRRIRPDGIIERVAGAAPGAGRAVEGTPALEVEIRHPRGIAVAPDGTLSFAEQAPGPGGTGIRTITTDGLVHYTRSVTWGVLPYGQTPAGPLTLGPNGDLYYAVGGVHRLTSFGADQELVPLPTSFYFNTFTTASVGPDGSVLAADNWRIVRLLPSGDFEQLAGWDRTTEGSNDPGLWDQPSALAMSVHISDPGLKISPDGLTYLIHSAQANGTNLWREQNDLEGYVFELSAVPHHYDGLDFYVASEDGEEVYFFDPEGRHRETRTPSGVVLWRMSYDAAGRIERLTDRDGGETRIERDGAGNPTAIVAPGGQQSVLTVGSNGFLSSITTAAGTTSLEIDDRGLLRELGEPGGGRHRFTYTTEGRLLSDENEAGEAKSFVFNPAPERLSTVRSDASGERTFTLETLPDNTTRRTTVDANGAVEQWDYVAAGRERYTRSDGTVITSRPSSGTDESWNGDVQLTGLVRIQTPGGVSYEARHRREVRRIDDADPLSATRIEDEVTVNGNTFRRRHDLVGRSITSTSATRRVQRVLLDERDRPIRFWADRAAIQSPIEYHYDAAGYLIRVNQGTTGFDYEYDSSGLLVGETNSLGEARRYAYDPAGRLVELELASGGRLGFGYDSAGRRDRVTMPSGAVHVLAYDPTGVPIGYTPPGGTAFVTTLRPDRRAARLSYGGTSNLDFSYDVGGRLSMLHTSEADVSLSYFDSTQRPRELRRAPALGETSILTLVHDGPLVTSIAASGASVGTLEVSYGPDLVPTSLRFDGVQSRRQRDADGLVIGYGPFDVSRSGPRGLLSGVRLGPSEVLTQSYDGSGRESALSIDVGATHRARTHQFDALGRLSTRVDTFGADADTYEYDYSVDGALVGVRRSNASGVRCERYAYDVNGNRTERRIGTCGAEELVETASYDAEDRPTSYGYDAAGRPTIIGDLSVSFGLSGELIRATKAGGPTVTYSYDALGRRVLRTDGARRTEYFYEDRSSRLSYSREAGVLTEYYYDDAGRCFGLRRDGQIYWIISDPAGTPLEVLDAAGATLMSARYDAFGGPLTAAPAAFELAIGFGGGLSDPVTGLTRFGSREYDPRTGRFLTRDTLRFAGLDANLFRYSYGDPVNMVDRNGHLGIGTIVAAGLAALAALTAPGALDAAPIAADAGNQYPGAGSSGPGDAIRHCTWSCEMTKGMDSFRAWVAGMGNEALGALTGQPWNDLVQDVHNNEVGRELGREQQEAEKECQGKKGKKNCADRCGDALSAGRLIPQAGQPPGPWRRR